MSSQIMKRTFFAPRGAGTGWSPGTGWTFGGPGTGAAPELVRDFIWRALYDPQSGYFATTPCLHAPVAPLDFTELRGKSEYTEKLAGLYAAEDDAWLTPVEIFAVRLPVLLDDAAQ